MADESNAPAAVDNTKVTEESTRPADVPLDAAPTETKPAEGGDVAAADEAAKDPGASTTEQATEDVGNLATEAQGEPTVGGVETVADPSADLATTNGTPASSKKANNNRRKSGAGIPEHKKKTPSKKKKGGPELHLDAKAGQHWFVAMKGYPPWPVVIAEEDMLPETLLAKRPVSARRIDGSYREDFADGGKNAKDRRYPVMFLSTNEFAWQVNTDLQPFDIEAVKKEVESGNNTKKSKALWAAYEIAAEGHDLAWYKEVLHNHEAALQADQEQKEAKKTKASKRKSAATINEPDDAEMEDVADEAATASTKKAKAPRKRKSPPESDAEQEKPAKTPKLKLNNKSKEKDSSAAKPKKEPKTKKPQKSEEEPEATKVEEKPLTEEERIEMRSKKVLYLRHKLQKGFISRDHPPKDEDMSNMSDFIRQLEEYQDLEAAIIKKTKVHKVLKAIIKLDSIPKEDEFHFKTRSNDLLNTWNRALAADVETTAAKTEEPPTTSNGVKHDEDEPKEGSKPAATVEPVAPADADVPMADADAGGASGPTSEATPVVEPVAEAAPAVVAV